MAKVTEVRTASAVLSTSEYSDTVRIHGTYIGRGEVADLMLGLAMLCPDKIPDHIRASLQRVVDCEEALRLNVARQALVEGPDDGPGPDHAEERALEVAA